MFFFFLTLWDSVICKVSMFSLEQKKGANVNTCYSHSSLLPVSLCLRPSLPKIHSTNWRKAFERHRVLWKPHTKNITYINMGLQSQHFASTVMAPVFCFQKQSVCLWGFCPSPTRGFCQLHLSEYFLWDFFFFQETFFTSRHHQRSHKIWYSNLKQLKWRQCEPNCISSHTFLISYVWSHTTVFV